MAHRPRYSTVLRRVMSSGSIDCAGASSVWPYNLFSRRGMGLVLNLTMPLWGPRAIPRSVIQLRGGKIQDTEILMTSSLEAPCGLSIITKMFQILGH